MQIAINSFARLWQRFTLTRYFAASVIALGVDTLFYLMLHAAGLHAATASMLGYATGIAVHWAISAHIVFPDKVRVGSALLRQRVLFAISALIGLALTGGVVALATQLGASPLLAKIFAVGTSFTAVYAIRKWGIFR
ncbi:GtrA family protein [Sphingorhabdus sp.]|jgi:putative flippase GtrA|uniref:GtrA family protein n=1 Tax=Sphingorhabdus sp. TaxID=1902408 RepID=UPI0037C984D7